MGTLGKTDWRLKGKVWKPNWEINCTLLLSFLCKFSQTPSTMCYITSLAVCKWTTACNKARQNLALRMETSNLLNLTNKQKMKKVGIHQHTQRQTCRNTFINTVLWFCESLQAAYFHSCLNSLKQVDARRRFFKLKVNVTAKHLSVWAGCVNDDSDISLPVLNSQLYVRVASLRR